MQTLGHEFRTATTNSNRYSSTLPALDYLSGLYNKNVGVVEGTANLRAARGLREQYDFKIDSFYSDYAGVYQAMERYQIEYALVDGVLLQQFLGNGYHK